MPRHSDRRPTSTVGAGTGYPVQYHCQAQAACWLPLLDRRRVQSSRGPGGAPCKTQTDASSPRRGLNHDAFTMSGTSDTELLTEHFGYPPVVS